MALGLEESGGLTPNIFLEYAGTRTGQGFRRI